MNVPKKVGKTQLAYITEEERKLLRRRDAVKGSPNKKVGPQGIPRLEGGSDWMMDQQRQAELEAKEKALYDAGFTTMTTIGGQDGGGEIKYVNPTTGQSAGYLGAPTTPIKYGEGPDEVFKIGGSTLGTPKPSSSSTTSSGTSSGGGVSGGGGGGGGGGGSTPVSTGTGGGGSSPTEAADYWQEAKDLVIDTSKLTQPFLDEIVAQGASAEVLESRLKDLIQKNNPLFRAATTKALQAMASRGLLNSSLAEEAVMNSIMSVAIPIAQRDADAYMQQRMQNQGYENEFRAAQNQNYYQSFITRLQGTIEMALRQLTERSANWRAVLAQRGAIATTPGMGASAAGAGLGTVTPDWWYQ